MNIQAIKEGYLETKARYDEIKEELAKKFPAFALLKHLEETMKTYEVILKGIPIEKEKVEKVKKVAFINQNAAKKYPSAEIEVYEALKSYGEPLRTREIMELLPKALFINHKSKTHAMNALSAILKSLCDQNKIQRKRHNGKGYLYWY